MTRLSLNVDDEVVIDEQIFIVVRRLQGERLQLQHCETAEPLILTDEELVRQWTENRVILKRYRRRDRFGEKVATRTEQMRRDFDALDETQKREARRRLAYVKGILETRPRAITQSVVATLIPQVAAAMGEWVEPVSRVQPETTESRDDRRRAPSASSVCRWIGLWDRADGDIRILVDATHRRGNRRRRLHQDVVEAIDGFVSELFMSRPGNPAKDVWAAVVNYINELNQTREAAMRIPFPSLKAIYRAIAKVDKRDLTAARHGPKLARHLYDPVGKSQKPEWPLQRVEIDHTKLDVFVVDEHTNLPIGRPVLTFLIDAFSRMIVGWHVGFDPPGCTAVAHALRHAILPKYYIKDLYSDIPENYPTMGRPYTLICDIGAEFLSTWFVDACNQLGINLQYCRGGCPKEKGTVERGIRTCSEDLVHKIPGTAFSNIAKRGDYKSQDLAIITKADLDHLVHFWIVRVYSRSFHRGLRGIPEQIWNEGVLQHPVTMPPEADDLNALLSKVEKRTLQRTGIEYMGLRYNDHRVAALMRKYGSGASVRIRVDPDNMEHIYLHDALTDRYVSVPSVEPEYTRGMTLAQHKIISEYCRKRAKGYITIESLCEARVHLQKLVSDIFRNKKGKRSQKAALFLGVGDPNAVRDAQWGAQSTALTDVSPEHVGYTKADRISTYPDNSDESEVMIVDIQAGPGGAENHLQDEGMTNRNIRASKKPQEDIEDLDAEVHALGWTGD